jgi:NAD(P)-dependent dehydrogenase (short-subunit alcohol dehydrogenase family)
MRRFSGTVAIVTGGGAGIGAAQVELLTRRGALVCAVDIDEDAAVRSGAALAVGADVADREAMAAAVERVVDTFGRLDYVFCTAGVTHPPSTMRALAPGVAQRVIEVNLNGTVNTVHPAIGPLIESGGHIVLVSSMGWPANTDWGTMLPAVGGVAYSTSKTAVEMLGRGLRMELSPHGVGVTITYFGPIDTAMVHNTPVPMTREKQRVTIGPDEAAAAVLRAVEREKVRVIVPARWNFLNAVRPLGVHLDNLLLRSGSQRQFIGRYDRPEVTATSTGSAGPD